METVVALFTALFLGLPITAGAIATGQQQRLCDALGGTYEANYSPSYPVPDSCPGGSWGKFWHGIANRPK
jgi:hypothetical protein